MDDTQALRPVDRLHNGGTGGYHSFLGFDPGAGVGVAVITNTFTAAGVDDIGMHLLDPDYPSQPAPREHQVVAIEPKLLDLYVAQYQLAPNFVLTITRGDDQLFAQATGQGKAPIFAESDNGFFYKIVEAQITFETDASGQVTGLTLHQNGANIQAKRIGAIVPFRSSNALPAA